MPRKSTISVIPNDPGAPHHAGVLFIEGIPMTTKSAFKARCAQLETPMRDVIIQFMRDYIRASEAPRPYPVGIKRPRLIHHV